MQENSNSLENVAHTANGETTDFSIEAVKYPVISGAARQIFGSSSLRTSGNNNNKQSKKRKSNLSSVTSTTHHPNNNEDYDEYDGRYSHGVVITEPHPVPPPFDPSFRVIGGVRVPGIDSEIYGPRKHGERQGDVDESWKPWDRFDDKPEHGRHAISNVMHSGGELMHMPNAHMIDDETDPEDRQDEQPCTLGCLNSAFLCPHSCQCVPKFTRCDGELQCELGEDEENCVGKFSIAIFIFFSFT